MVNLLLLQVRHTASSNADTRSALVGRSFTSYNVRTAPVEAVSRSGNSLVVRGHTH